MTVYFREVEEADWNYILKLRNDERFRPNFYEQHTILDVEHFEYLKKQQNNPNFFNWIICSNDNDVGYIRILDNDVSIILDDKFHNNGIGTESIRILEEKARSLGLKKLVGKMMIENKKSEKIFLNNDFKLKMFWYEKNLN